MIVFPGAAIFGFNLLGDGRRDAFHPGASRALIRTQEDRHMGAETGG